MGESCLDHEGQRQFATFGKRADDFGRLGPQGKRQRGVEMRTRVCCLVGVERVRPVGHLVGHRRGEFGLNRPQGRGDGLPDGRGAELNDFHVRCAGSKTAMIPASFPKRRRSLARMQNGRS